MDKLFTLYIFERHRTGFVKPTEETGLNGICYLIVALLKDPNKMVSPQCWCHVKCGQPETITCGSYSTAI